MNNPLTQLVKSQTEIDKLPKYEYRPKYKNRKTAAISSLLRDDTPDLAKRRWKAGGFGKPGARSTLQRYKKWLQRLRLKDK